MGLVALARARNGEPAAFVERAVAYTGDACLIWPYGKDSNGYGVVVAGRVHALVCARVNGPCPVGQEAAHSCGNPACCAPKHIRWDTHAGNMHDMSSAVHGTAGPINPCCGEAVNTAKLTAEDVLTIRASNLAQRSLAEVFNCTQANISAIVTRKTWKRV